ncbi:hypothetical protein D3C72_1424660 [compost metagenome]
MTSIPSDFMDAVERSWPLKLAWLCVPYVPITAVAVSLHADDSGSGLIAALPAIVVFGGAALPFLVGLLAQPAKKARRRYSVCRCPKKPTPPPSTKPSASPKSRPSIRFPASFRPPSPVSAPRSLASSPP